MSSQFLAFFWLARHGALFLLSLKLADAERVGAGAALLVGGGDDAVEAVFFRREDNARVEVVRGDIVILGQDFSLGALQADVGVEVLAGHLYDIGVAGAHSYFVDLLTALGGERAFEVR